MARTKKGTPPAYRRKKVRSHEYAYVRLDGQQIMLGHFGTAESRAEYARVVAEWEAAGCRLPDQWSDAALPTVEEIAADYVEYCKANYLRSDGT